MLVTWKLDIWWERAEEEKVVQNMFGVKKKGEKARLWGWNQKDAKRQRS